MSDGLTLEYALPLSALRFKGSVTLTCDKELGGEIARAASGSVTLDVVGDHRMQCLVLEHGWMNDTSASFELTDDGRLVSSDVQSTGQAGRVVLGVAAAV